MLAGAAVAQDHQHKHAERPYAGLEKQPVKALNDQQVADLRAGRGMGLALAAELNGYPGPLHVLELAAQLGLSAEQRNRVQQLYASMKGEAQKAGEQLIEQETVLDRLFKDRTITAESLTTVTGQIGQSQATLRNVHLKYHLTTAELLTPGQLQRYSELRGYR